MYQKKTRNKTRKPQLTAKSHANTQTHTQTHTKNNVAVTRIRRKYSCENITKTASRRSLRGLLLGLLAGKHQIESLNFARHCSGNSIGKTKDSEKIDEIAENVCLLTDRLSRIPALRRWQEGEWLTHVPGVQSTLP